jgi:FAD/FMN-containing dehydrogenase
MLSTDRCEAMAIVRPTNTEQVSQILKLCHESHQGVVTVGGATGLVRSGMAGPDEILLSLELMRNIEELDSSNRTATVQAGVTMQALQEQAEKEGLFYPVDFGARGSATIGGNIGTNAGGERVIRYGMTRAQVLGLEVVLADGSVLSSMKKLMKDKTGYDLKQLFIGSEGTLGVVTRAVLRLRPAVKHRNVAFLAVSSFDNVIRILGQVDESMAGGLAAFEVMWQEFYTCVLNGHQQHTPPLPDQYPYYVLLENHGGENTTDEIFMSTLESLYEQGLVEDIAVAMSEREREAMWAIRDSIEAIVAYLGEGGVSYDVSLPVNTMETYIDTVRSELTQWKPETKMITFGHMGDGNLHIGISVGSWEPEIRDRMNKIVYTPLDEIGGSISAEHGIGIDKKPYLSMSRSGKELEMMRQIKSAFDPRGILNPGKIF